MEIVGLQRVSGKHVSWYKHVLSVKKDVNKSEKVLALLNLSLI
jgi:hypothetical protein